MTQTPRLTVIHLARKPLEGTVAGNVHKYGTGGLNIDGTRIGAGDSLGGAKPQSLLRTQKPQDNGGSMRPGEWKGGVTGSVAGRWPANLILSHEPGCRMVGTHYEEFSLMNYLDSTSGNFSFFAESEVVHGAVEGKKTGQMVEDWECIEGCPCLDLNQQSGVLHTHPGNGIRGTETGRGMGYHGAGAGSAVQVVGDSGGASRFFKQVLGE